MTREQYFLLSFAKPLMTFGENFMMISKVVIGVMAQQTIRSYNTMIALSVYHLQLHADN